MALPRAHITAVLKRLARLKSVYIIHWGINMCACRSNFSRCIQALACACFIMISPLCRADADVDPWESFNRPVFAFNDRLDTYALKPLARGYQFVTPRIAQDGVHDFFNNLGEVKNLANNLRDAPAMLPDAYANPVRYIADVPTRNSLYGVSIIDGRAQYLKAEKLITGDKYNFIRSVYLQNREFRIQGGNVADDF